MRKMSMVFLSLLLILSTNVFANTDLDKMESYNQKQTGGIDYTYSSPEMFFTTPTELKLSVVWEILNCFRWVNGVPVDECLNLELFVVNETPDGDVTFTSDLTGTECLVANEDGTCEGIVKLPVVALLSPHEYQKWQMGLVVVKNLYLYLGYGGEEDENGRIVGRKTTATYYKLKYILNGTGFGSVAIVTLERVNSVP